MKEDLNKLNKYESYFKTAINSDYCRALWKDDFDILTTIYKKWTGEEIITNMNCNTCKLKFMKKLGKLYFKYKEEYGKIEVQSEIKQSEQECRQKNIHANKRGKRPSK